MLDVLVGLEIWVILPAVWIYSRVQRRPVRLTKAGWVDRHGRPASRYKGTMSQSAGAGGFLS